MKIVEPSIFDRLMSELNELNWQDPDECMGITEEILHRTWKKRGELFLALADKAKEIIPSVRTNELVSWKLGTTKNGTSVALNEFFPGPKGEESVNIHEHAQPITVLGVRGGYNQKYYAAPKPTEQYEEGENFEGFREWNGPTTSPGFVYSMGLDVLRAVTSFKPGTVSFTVYAPRVKDKTTVFNTITGKAEYRYSFRKATDDLRERVLGWAKEES